MKPPLVCRQSTSFFYQLPNRRMVQTTYDDLIENHYDVDCYFCPNNCPTESILDLKSLEWLFVDVDAGRRQDGTYFADGFVRQRKKKLLYEIKERAELDVWYDEAPTPWNNWKADTASPEFYNIAPTVVVETRNGYHLYWRIVSCPVTMETLTKYNRVQWIMRQLFNGDPLAVKANQLMRVPDTVWRKPYEGDYTAFECEEVNLNIDIRADAFIPTTLTDYFNLLDKRVFTQDPKDIISFSGGDHQGQKQAETDVVPLTGLTAISFDDDFVESVEKACQEIGGKTMSRALQTLELIKQGVSA